MAEVAYLLGAGASAQCLPIVSDMAEDIGKLKLRLQKYNINFKDHFSKRHDEKLYPIIKECDEILTKLQRVCARHSSIDTYAKKLYLTNTREFNKLKVELSAYFSLVQLLNPQDKRYDNFFASILTQKSELPPKVKIFSWNYDSQFELSYSQFNYNKPLDETRRELRTFTPGDCADLTMYQNRFFAVKLNGTAAFKHLDGYKYLINNGHHDLLSRLYSFYYSFEDLKLKLEDTDLKFAWESSNHNDLFENMNLALENIEVLVIIGYSFPFFNRVVDKELFSRMKNLKTIYIQDMYPENVKETMEEFVRFNIGSSTLIKTVFKRNLNQFAFPKELDISLF